MRQYFGRMNRTKMKKLSREKLILKLLISFNEGFVNIYNSLNMDFQEYVKLIQEMEMEKLIQDVGIVYAGDEVCELVPTNITVTPEGIKYLHNIENEIQKNILEVLYENKFTQTMNGTQIRRGLFLSLNILEVESQLNILIRNDLVESEQGANGIGYKLSQKGISSAKEGYDENGLIKHSFPAVRDLKIGIEAMINEKVSDRVIKKDIKTYLNELMVVASKEKIDKIRLKEIFNKIASKGFDEVTDASFSLLIGAILESQK